MNPAKPTTKYLIADDDLRARQMLKEVLGKPGIEFIEAGDGREAVELYQAHHPDLVIMDIEMKPIDGIEATRVIHEHDAECRVLIVSQHDGPGFRNAAAVAGAFGYVLKEDFEAIPGVIANQLRPPTEN